MFHIYIHDYCNKRGYTKTARELVNEADIPPDSQPPINARQGLLFEWWSVFWTLFTAKNSGTGSDEALIYTQYQVQQQALRAQNRNQPQPPINRMMNGMPPRQPLQMPPTGGGMPNGMPGAQGMPNGHMSFPMSNQPGHPPSGPGNAPGGPQQQLNMGMMPGQRTMGGVPQPQQPGQGMVQMPGNQHMGQMNRTMLQHGPSSMANHVPGTQQAHSPNYPQQIGRPSSRPTTPSQGVITNPSPSMAHRLPPGAVQAMNEISAELMRIPGAHLPKIKQELMIPQDKDFTTMTADEKHRIVNLYRTKYRAQTQPGPGGPQQPQNPAGPSSTPLMAPANVRNNPQAQQRGKRGSTSPGQDEGSSPKRPRPSPSGGDHPNPPGPPQTQPPMASMAPFNAQQGGGPPGPQNMQNGMHRPPMNMAYQSMGFGPPMSPGMGSIPTPGMMNNSVHMTPEVGPMQNYRQSMQKLHHKGMGPPMTANNAGSPLSNPPQTAGGPPFNVGGMNQTPSTKPVPGMMPPPPSPGMNKAQQNGGDKPGEPGARPESSPGRGPQPGPQNPGQPSQPPSATQQPQQSQQPPQHPQPPSSQPGQGPTNQAPATPSAPPSLGADAASGLMDLPQSAMPGLGDLPWDMGDFDQALFRQDPGDLNFERDFGQWFNPGGDVTLDMK